MTFCLVALDPEDRLRYPLVSLLFDMCWWSWLARGAWENLCQIFLASRLVLVVGFRGVDPHVVPSWSFEGSVTVLSTPVVPGTRFGF